MRLRNIARAKNIVENHQAVMNLPQQYKNHWFEVFNNNNPIHIEIGMGKGQFITEKALSNPETNYVGIERYTSVLLRALEGLDKRKSERGNPIEPQPFRNLRFICMDAREITEVFREGEVSKIYLNFSDPWPKSRHASRRLTSVEFLKRYQQILKKEGRLEFKTDNVDLFDFSLWQIKEGRWNLEATTRDLHQDEALNQNNMMTEYEEKFSSEGLRIYKLICSPPKIL